MILQVHPEYWSLNQINLLDEMNKNNINIMYMGGNGLYWKYTIVDKYGQMEVRKDRKNHLDGTIGGLMNELGLSVSGEDILKIFYKNIYSTAVLFNFPYNITQPNHFLFNGIDISGNQIGFKNLNSKTP